MGSFFSSLRDLFYSKKLDIVLVGLENSGKTTFCNYLSLNKFVEEPPTVGLNVRVVQKGNVTLKVWDIGGQEKYRSEWPRYTRGCNVIVFVVDSQQPTLLPSAKKELHQLLEDRELSRLPLLLLVNKIDLGPKFTEKEVIEGMNLDYISETPWVVLPVSAKLGTAIDQALQFLIKHGK